jgi:hypothetical protein
MHQPLLQPLSVQIQVPPDGAWIVGAKDGVALERGHPLFSQNVGCPGHGVPTDRVALADPRRSRARPSRALAVADDHLGTSMPADGVKPILAR